MSSTSSLLFANAHVVNEGHIVAADVLVRGDRIERVGSGAVPAGTLRDLDGRPRFFDDRGAPDVGLGTRPLVDMGAYERVSLPPKVRRL